MNVNWKRSMATGAMFVVTGLGGVGLADAAGRIGERLATVRASSTKEKPPTATEEEADKSLSGRLGRRALASGKSTRGGKRKEVPPEAKEALDHLQGLQIDPGDSVDSLDTPPLAPPEVPPTDERTSAPGVRSRTEPRLSGEPRVTRRPVALSRKETSPTELPNGGESIRLTAPVTRPASSR